MAIKNIEKAEGCNKHSFVDKINFIYEPPDVFKTVEQYLKTNPNTDKGPYYNPCIIDKYLI